MGLLGRLFHRDSPPPPASSAVCPECGAELKPFWGEDDLVVAVGIGPDRQLPPGEHLVLRVKCACGYEARANSIRVLNPQLYGRLLAEAKLAAQ